MTDILLKISTIFIMIFIGFAASRLKFVPSDAQNGLVKMILSINIPCMLICSLTQNELSEGPMAATIKMLCFSAVYFVIAALISELLPKLFRIREPDDIGVYKILFTSINTGFIGFPLTKALFGDETLYFMALHNIVLNICLYSICMIQLNSGNREKDMLKKMIKSMINPCIISAVLGIILLFAGIAIPSYIQGILQPIGDATIPVAMIVVGLQLAEGKIIDCFMNKKLLIFSAITMIVRPVIVLLIVNMLPITAILKVVLVLGAAFPPVTTVSALAANEGKNYKLAADATIVMTLIAAATIPMITMLIHMYL